MSGMVQILDPSAASSIRNFELTILAATVADPMDRELASWNAPWRDESLRHYLATGWSVGLWSSDDAGSLKGYFLAQPLLFFQGLTQVLWVEYISSDSEESTRILIETAVKYARDRHLQSVFYREGANVREIPTTKR